MAALLLLDEGATAAELAQRFAPRAIVEQAQDAGELLARLASLGLVMVTSTDGAQARYVPTLLGEQYASAVLGGRPEVTIRLEELERLRTDLLATIAHELRTPLTAIRTCVGLLRDPSVEPEPEAHAQLLLTIEQSAERMQRLVTDVLDLTRFRAGGIRLQLRRFDACVLAREVAAAMTPLLAVRGQRLELRLPRAPAWVYGDRRRLEQALLNLVSNAYKFSPDGVVVQLSVRAQDGDISWAVADSGPGISEADRVRLFERFFTAATDAAGVRAGSGLGLPIARAIALAHGGAIEVESAVGRGSTFTLRVPASGPDGAAEP